MPLSPPSGFSASHRVPTIAIAVNLGVGARSAGAASKRIALLGNKTSAGSAVLDTPQDVYSLDEVATYAGLRSELYQAAKRIYAQKRDARLTIVPVTQSAGVAATCELLFAGTAAAGTVAVTVQNVKFEISVTASDTPTTVAAALAAAINADSDLPCTAGASTGTLTLTWAQTGTRGNLANVRCVINGAGVTVALNGNTASAVKVKGKFGSANGGAGVSGTDFVPGTQTDSISTALGNMAPVKYDLIVLCQADATNLGLAVTHANTYSGASGRKRTRVVIGSVDSVANAKVVTIASNAKRGVMAWSYYNEFSPGELAAAKAALMLWGDGQSGGRVKGEESYVACNKDGGLLAGVPEQIDVADQPLDSHISDAINYGISPLVPSGVNPGYLQVNKSVCIYHADGSGNPDYRVHDTSKVAVADFVADNLENDIADEFSGRNLAPEADEAPQNRDVIYPSMVKAFIAKRLYEWERQGILVKVEDNLPLLAVEVSPGNDTLLLAEIPVSVIPHFHGFLGNENQIG